MKYTTVTVNVGSVSKRSSLNVTNLHDVAIMIIIQ